MIGQMCFDRFESLETPATISPLVIILLSTRSYYNQLVITNRYARHTFLNARILKLSKPVDLVCRVHRRIGCAEAILPLNYPDSMGVV